MQKVFLGKPEGIFNLCMALLIGYAWFKFRYFFLHEPLGVGLTFVLILGVVYVLLDLAGFQNYMRALTGLFIELDKPSSEITLDNFEQMLNSLQMYMDKTEALVTEIKDALEIHRLQSKPFSEFQAGGQTLKATTILNYLDLLRNLILQTGRESLQVYRKAQQASDPAQILTPVFSKTKDFEVLVKKFIDSINLSKKRVDEKSYKVLVMKLKDFEHETKKMKPVNKADSKNNSSENNKYKNLFK